MASILQNHLYLLKNKPQILVTNSAHLSTLVGQSYIGESHIMSGWLKSNSMSTCPCLLVFAVDHQGFNTCKQVYLYIPGKYNTSA